MDNLKFCPKPSCFVPREEMVLTLLFGIVFSLYQELQHSPWNGNVALLRKNAMV